MRVQLGEKNPTDRAEHETGIVQSASIFHHPEHLSTGVMFPRLVARYPCGAKWSCGEIVPGF
jgi:hypothetical protein